jgi:hypothetical protein
VTWHDPLSTPLPPRGPRGAHRGKLWMRGVDGSLRAPTMRRIAPAARTPLPNETSRRRGIVFSVALARVVN